MANIYSNINSAFAGTASAPNLARVGLTYDVPLRGDASNAEW